MISSMLIEATAHTPKLVINAENIYEGITIEISGESVPEDTRKFYAPVFQWIDNLDKYIEKNNHMEGEGIRMTSNFRMEYFNSSSAKIFIMLMEILSELKIKYPKMVVTINWMYDDEDILEAGEEFKSLVSVPFNIVQNHFIIKGGKNTPDVIISPLQKKFKISGKSFMEKTDDFYEPILNWIKQYGKQYFKNDFQFDFRLSYFNTPSAKCLFLILKKLNEVYMLEKNIGVNWYYEDDDELEEIKSITGNLQVPIKYIQANL